MADFSAPYYFTTGSVYRWPQAWSLKSGVAAERRRVIFYHRSNGKLIGNPVQHYTSIPYYNQNTVQNMAARRVPAIAEHQSEFGVATTLTPDDSFLAVTHWDIPQRVDVWNLDVTARVTATPRVSFVPYPLGEPTAEDEGLFVEAVHGVGPNDLITLASGRLTRWKLPPVDNTKPEAVPKAVAEQWGPYRCPLLAVPGNDWFVVSTGTGFAVIDAATLRPLADAGLPDGRELTGLRLSRDGRFVLLESCQTSRHEAYLFHLATGEGSRLSFSDDGAHAPGGFHFIGRDYVAFGYKKQHSGRGYHRYIVADRETGRFLANVAGTSSRGGEDIGDGSIYRIKSEGSGGSRKRISSTDLLGEGTPGSPQRVVDGVQLPCRVAVHLTGGNLKNFESTLAGRVAHLLQQSGVKIGDNGWTLRVMGKQTTSQTRGFDPGLLQNKYRNQSLKYPAVEVWYEAIDPAGQSVAATFKVLEHSGNISRFKAAAPKQRGNIIVESYNIPNNYKDLMAREILMKLNGVPAEVTNQLLRLTPSGNASNKETP